MDETDRPKGGLPEEAGGEKTPPQTEPQPAAPAERPPSSARETPLRKDAVGEAPSVTAAADKAPAEAPKAAPAGPRRRPALAERLSRTRRDSHRASGAHDPVAEPPRLPDARRWCTRRGRSALVAASRRDETETPDSRAARLARLARGPHRRGSRAARTFPESGPDVRRRRGRGALLADAIGSDLLPSRA